MADKNSTTVSNVFFVGFWPDYETYFLRTVELEAYNCTVFNPKTHYEAQTGFHWMPRVLQNGFYVSVIRKLLKQHPTALFIFQGDNNMLELLTQQKHLPKVAILMRNICKPESKTAELLAQLKKRGALVFSFDRQNCAQQDFIIYQQFAEKLLQPMLPIDYDFCFVGKDKGRMALLNRIKQETEQLGYKTHIEIQGIKKVKPRRGTQSGRTLCYTDYLNKQLNCRCIIDINQPDQQGLTLRPLEALLYEKKLLTNNQNIREEAFFHPDNIFLIKDETDYSAIKTFMDKPYTKVAPQLVNQYRTTPIIRSIIKKTESFH